MNLAKPRLTRLNRHLTKSGQIERVNTRLPMADSPSRAISDRDALLIMIKTVKHGPPQPFSAELRGGLTRLRFHFTPGATIQEAFGRDAADCFGGLLATVASAKGIVAMPNFEVAFPGVTLRECRATAAPTRLGDQLISLRFRSCEGNALRLFSDAALPRTSLIQPEGRGSVDVVSEVLMPLFNLRQFLAETPAEDRDGHAQALTTMLRKVESQIGEIEDCYFKQIEERRGHAGPLTIEGAEAPGVEGALARLRGDAARAPSTAVTAPP
jgi:hypothetical protein